MRTSICQLKINNSRLSWKTLLRDTLKKLVETKEKLNKFVKGKESLDSLTMLTSNKDKKGLGFEGNSSHNSKKNHSKDFVIRFAKVSDQKSHFKQSPLYCQKTCQLKNLKISSKTNNQQHQRLKQFELIQLKSSSKQVHPYQKRQFNFTQ